MRGVVPVCQPQVSTCTLSTRIGEMFVDICPQGLHKLSQSREVSATNFIRCDGEGVEVIAKETEDEDILKHLTLCCTWLTVYFKNAHAAGAIPKPQLCSNVISEGGGFQQRVWLRLAELVGPGTVVSYGTLASCVDSPVSDVVTGASQAVGTAMASNPFQILVPCHRVIRSDGSVGLYDSGRRNEVKRWLLVHEGWDVVDGKLRSSTTDELAV